MIRFPWSPRAPLPAGWQHSRLTLHRAWHSRRTWQHRARGVLIAVAITLLIVWVLQLSPVWLLLAFVGALAPIPKEAQTLSELERTHGGAYTTALNAPNDTHGFKDRLEGMAATVQKNAELPAWPWLEILGIMALLSLVLVLPHSSSMTPNDGSRSVPPISRNSGNELLNGSRSTEAPPVLDAPSQNAPAGDATAKPGAAASSGAPGEQQLGQVKPGGGEASDDPQAVSKEFLEALERNAVRDRNENGQNDGSKVEDANPPSVAQNGGGDQDGNQGQNQSPQEGQDGARDGTSQSQNQNGQRGNSSNGQQGQNGQQNGQPNGQNQAGNQSGNQQGSSANDGQQNGQQRGQGQGQSANKNASRDRADRNNIDEGDARNGDQGSNGNGDGQPNNRSAPGQGNRGSSQAVAVNRPKTDGKLEYLPGTVKGNNVRSGALQLPGDPKNGFTSAPGSASYRRSAEAAVLDPRLPPEYQEMLKNYYK